MTISDEQLQAAKERLTVELEEIRSELEELGAHPDGTVDVSHDEGFADAAQGTSERSKVLSIVENLQSRLNDVEAALTRIDRGTYGKCERCGEEISAERLEAIPSARLCINDAQRR